MRISPEKLWYNTDTTAEGGKTAGTMKSFLFYIYHQHRKKTNGYYKALVHGVLLILFCAWLESAKLLGISTGITVYLSLGMYCFLPVLFFIEERGRIAAMAYGLLFYVTVFLAPPLLIFFTRKEENE